MPNFVMAVMLTVGSAAFTGCHGESPPGASSEIAADSVAGFSGEQGANGWFYGYWDRTADPDKTYDQRKDFQRLRFFGGDPKNRLSSHREFTTGKLWNLQDGVYYTSLWAEGGHPNGTMKLGEYAPVEQWAVRRWKSTIEGPVTISGKVGKVMPWGENWRGNCKAMIVVDGKTLYTAAIDDLGTEYSIDTKVQIGSLVDFLIGPDPSVGVSTFTAVIQIE